MENIQLRGIFFKDLGEPKFLDRTLSGVAGRLQRDMGRDGRDNFPVLLRCLWRLDREESLVFIVFLRNRRSQTKVYLEQRCLGLFGWHHNEFFWKQVSSEVGCGGQALKVKAPSQTCQISIVLSRCGRASGCWGNQITCIDSRSYVLLLRNIPLGHQLVIIVDDLAVPW